jgi:hypothetical protein
MISKNHLSMTLSTTNQLSRELSRLRSYEALPLFTLTCQLTRDDKRATNAHALQGDDSMVQQQERMALYTRMRELYQWVTYRVTVRNWLSKYRCHRQLSAKV